MGLDLKDESKSVPINFTKDDINLYIKRFRALDTDNKGFITTADLRYYFKVCELMCTQPFPAPAILKDFCSEIFKRPG